MDAHEFFDTIYRDADLESCRLPIFMLPSKKSKLFASTADAAQWSVQHAAKQDVYFNVGLMRPDLAAGRGKTDDVVCITALAADIDIGNTVDDRKVRPNNRDEAMHVLRMVGLAPSIVVNSGHGLHAYWLLNEAWTFISDDAERERAVTFSRRWARTVQAVAKALSFDVDSTFDLARVLRVPGTINHKNKRALKPVEVIATTDARYGADDIEGMVVADDDAPGSENAAVGCIVLAPGRAIDSTMLEVACENSDRFAETWRMKRHDLRDQSPSAYDMSLVHHAIDFDWSDQDIADLLLTFRRKHGVKIEKAMRRDYVERTIRAARLSKSQDAAMNHLDEFAATIVNDPRPATDEEQRQGIFKNLRLSLRIPVRSIVKYGTDAAQYHLTLDGYEQDIHIGGVAALTNQTSFSNRIAEQINRRPHRMGAKKWDRVLDLMLSVLEVRDAEVDSRRQTAREYLGRYVEMNMMHKSDEWQLAAELGDPFVRDDALCVYAPKFREFVRTAFHDQLTRLDMSTVLRAVGGELVRIHGQRDRTEDRFWRWVWAIPLAELPDVRQAAQEGQKGGLTPRSGDGGYDDAP